LAGALLELAGKARAGHGEAIAKATIDDGRAWLKFQRICEAQGGMRTPPTAQFREALRATRAGIVTSLDNRRLATLAKLSGAPESKAAGLEMHVKLGDRIGVGEPLCTIHAEAKGEMRYALDYAAANPTVFGIAD
jgi:thymidine phosphorylase